MAVSIKLLNISLVLLCIVTTAFICTYLSITSTNTALDDTKASRTTTVSGAFTVGSESVTERTAEYIELLLKSTVEFLDHFAQANKGVSATLASEIEAAAWDEVKYYDWHRLSHYFHQYELLRPDGNSGITVILKNYVMIREYEDTATIYNPLDGYHSMKVELNYGKDDPYGGYGKSFTAQNDGKGYPFNVTNPLTDVNWNASSCRKSAVATNGSVPDEPCGDSAWDLPLFNPDYWLKKFAVGKQPIWTNPHGVNEFVGLTCITPIYHKFGSRYSITGTVAAEADVRHLSKHLATLKIGGPVAGYPSRGRVFVTIRSCLVTYSTGGEIVAASHGSTIYPYQGRLVAMYTQESDDPIISQIGYMVNTFTTPNVADVAQAGNYTVLTLNTSYAPDGEEFYYRVGNLTDGSLDWYVHVVIDRAYMMNSIDQQVNETREEIDRSEKHVDDNLNKARTELYVSVAAVAVGLTALSTLLVFRIIEPLVVLEREMAAVAVMKLEEVNTGRPLSALEEVHLMQVSFLQMIRNLVEYRNYMPASVLQQVSDSGSETPQCSDVDESGSVITASSKSAKGIIKAPQVLLGGEVHVRKVTLMVCNIVDFLRVCEVVRVQQVITNYLSAGLHHLKLSKGIPDSFSGDRLYASWNGVRPCGSHRFAAYQCAKEMCGDKGIGARLSIGLASGDVKCGNMGCDGMKKFSYIGGLSSWVHVVERIGRSMECEVAVDAVVNEEVHNRAYTRMLQHVVFAKMGEQVLVVHEALGERETVRDEEWMYQLEERLANDPYKAYNRSYELFMEGRVEEAIRTLGEYNDGTSVAVGYKARLLAAALDTALSGPLGKEGAPVSW